MSSPTEQEGVSWKEFRNLAYWIQDDKRQDVKELEDQLNVVLIETACGWVFLREDGTWDFDAALFPD